MKTIGELFIKLGFKIDGIGHAMELDKSMTKLASNAGKMLAVVGAINAGFYLMLNAAGDAAQELLKFNVSTGLSSEELQRWQLAAAKAGTSAESVKHGFKAMQSAMALVQQGKGNFAPFQFFGVSVNQSVQDAILTLHENIRKSGMTPGAVRARATEFGLSEDFIQFLQRASLGLDEVNEKFIVTDEERNRLAAMNAQWQELLRSLDNVKIRFMSIFGDHMRKGLETLEKWLDKLAQFVDWLEGGSTGAELFKMALDALILTLGVLAAALTGLVAFATLSFAPVLVEVGLVTFAILLLVMAVADFWTAMKGGDSKIKWPQEMIKEFTGFLELIDKITTKLAVFWKAIDMTDVFFPTFTDETERARLAKLNRPAGVSSGAPVTQNNSVVFNVEGNGDNEDLTNRIHRLWDQEIKDAAGNIVPVAL